MNQGACSADGSNSSPRIVVPVTSPQGSRHVNLTHSLGPIPPLPQSVQIVSPSLIRIYGGRGNRPSAQSRPNAQTSSPQPQNTDPPPNRRLATNNNNNNNNNPQQGWRPPASPRRNQYTLPANPTSLDAHNNQNARHSNLSGPRNSNNPGALKNQNGQTISKCAAKRRRANARRAARQAEEQAAQNGGGLFQQPVGRHPANWPLWPIPPPFAGAGGWNLSQTEPTFNDPDIDIPPRNTTHHPAGLSPHVALPPHATTREEPSHHPARISNQRLEALISAAIPYIPPHNPWNDDDDDSSDDVSSNDWLTGSGYRSFIPIHYTPVILPPIVPAPIIPTTIISAPIRTAPVQPAPAQPTTPANARPTPAQTNPARPATIQPTIPGLPNLHLRLQVGRYATPTSFVPFALTCRTNFLHHVLQLIVPIYQRSVGHVSSSTSLMLCSLAAQPR
ncbi:hypothetical protein BDV93DRAFT_163902 [Ceratobasidium sp. AG-I]|nr:hypothetical protein BDV93DRAFT_163902 [Ceratobasidium sp. AG-I]